MMEEATQPTIFDWMRVMTSEENYARIFIASAMTLTRWPKCL